MYYHASSNNFARRGQRERAFSDEKMSTEKPSNLANVAGRLIAKAFLTRSCHTAKSELPEESK